MNSNQPVLVPDVYKICIAQSDSNAKLFIHHQDGQSILIENEVDGSQSQEWVLTAKSDSTTLYSVYNIQSGQYLSLAGGKVTPATNLFWWTLVQDGMNYTIISADQSLKIQSSTDGAQVVAEPKSSNSQLWSFIPTAFGIYGPFLLKHKEAGTYLALKDGNTANKTPAQGFNGTAERKASLSFQWRVIPTGASGSNLVRIQNVASSTCLMKYGGPVAGAVQISGWQKVDHKWVAKPAPNESDAQMSVLLEVIVLAMNGR